MDDELVFFKKSPPFIDQIMSFTFAHFFEGGSPLIVRERVHKFSLARLWAPTPRLRSLQRALGSKLPFRKVAGLLWNCFVLLSLPISTEFIPQIDEELRIQSFGAHVGNHFGGT